MYIYAPESNVNKSFNNLTNKYESIVNNKNMKLHIKVIYTLC